MHKDVVLTVWTDAAVGSIDSAWEEGTSKGNGQLTLIIETDDKNYNLTGSED